MEYSRLNRKRNFLKHASSTLLLTLFLIIAVAVGIANMMLWDSAFNACVARGSSTIWCRFTEEWQIFRFIFGF